MATVRTTPGLPSLVNHTVQVSYIATLSLSQHSATIIYPGRDCRINGHSTYAVFANNGNALASSIIGIVVLLVTLGFNGKSPLEPITNLKKIFSSLYLPDKENLKKFLGMKIKVKSCNKG